MDQPTTEDRRVLRAARLREERRRQILDAALEVFARKGYRDARVSDVVLASGAARGTFYRYFPSKQAVFDALLDEMLSEVERGIVRIDLSPGAPPPLEQLEGNVVRLLSLSRSRPQLLRILLWEAAGVGDEVDHKLGSFHQRMFELLTRSLRLGIQVGLIRPCDVDVVAHCLFGLLKEVMLAQLLEPEGSDEDLDSLVSTLLDFALRGLLDPKLA